MIAVDCEKNGLEKVASEFPARSNYGPSFFAVDGPSRDGLSVSPTEKLEWFMALFTDCFVDLFDRDLSEGGAVVLV